MTNIGTPAGVGINAVVLPRPHRAVVAGSVGSNLYVSRWLLPPSRAGGQAAACGNTSPRDHTNSS
jgi:hypothetical protein